MDEFLCLVGKNSLLVVNICPCFVDRKADGVVFASRDDIAWVLRIESSEEGDRYVNILCDLLEVLALAGVDGVGNGVLGIGCWTDAMELGIVHGIARCDIDGQVSSCFLRQERVDAPEVPFASSPVDGLVDVTRSAVVCRDDKVPVIEDGVEVGKELTCGLGGAYGIHSFVHEGVDFESVFFACSRHKLP